MHFSLRAVLAASVLLIGAGAASADSLSHDSLARAEGRTIPYSGDISACDAWWVLKEITLDFNWHEPNFDSTLELVDFQRVGQVGYRTNGPQFIPRRYCAARALFNDGRVREVRYNLIEGGGFVGIGSGVEWCVVGLDRYHAYSPACRAAGP